MGSGGNKKLGPCTFWVLYRRYVPAHGGNTIWANRLIFSHQTYMGTVSDIRSRKKDDIGAFPYLICVCVSQTQIEKKND